MEDGAARGAGLPGGVHHKVRVAPVGDGHDEGVVRVLLHGEVLLFNAFQGIAGELAGGEVAQGGDAADAAKGQGEGDAVAGGGDLHGVQQAVEKEVPLLRRDDGEEGGLLRGLQAQHAEGIVAGGAAAQGREDLGGAEALVELHEAAAGHPVGDGDHQVQAFHVGHLLQSSSMMASTAAAGAGAGAAWAWRVLR